MVTGMEKTIRELYEGGMSVKKIAGVSGRSYRAVRRELLEQGATMRHVGRPRKKGPGR